VEQAEGDASERIMLGLAMIMHKGGGCQISSATLLSSSRLAEAKALNSRTSTTRQEVFGGGGIEQKAFSP
jgi:hypothetical protein